MKENLDEIQLMLVEIRNSLLDTTNPSTSTKVLFTTKELVDFGNYLIKLTKSCNLSKVTDKILKDFLKKQ